MASDNREGVWKSGKGKGRHTPKGRQLDDAAWDEVKALLGDQPRRADLLIEFTRSRPFMPILMSSKKTSPSRRR